MCYLIIFALLSQPMHNYTGKFGIVLFCASGLCNNISTFHPLGFIIWFLSWTALISNIIFMFQPRMYISPSPGTELPFELGLVIAWIRQHKSRDHFLLRLLCASFLEKSCSHFAELQICCQRASTVLYAKVFLFHHIVMQGNPSLHVTVLEGLWKLKLSFRCLRFCVQMFSLINSV